MRSFGDRRFRMCLAMSLAGMAAISLATGSSAQAQQSTAFNEAERTAIEAIVHDYLLENPEIIADALRELRTRQEMAAMAERQAQVVALSERLFSNPASPEMGNPDGDVTVVEFFDYNCGYCKTVRHDLFALVEQDPNVRVVFKELPILSPSSVTAARAALAAREQGLYIDYHNALMDHRGSMTDETVFALAEQVGLDVDQLRQDMGDPSIDQAIAGNLEMAQALGLRGTPAFIVGETIIPGAVGLDELRNAVHEARAG